MTELLFKIKEATGPKTYAQPLRSNWLLEQNPAPGSEVSKTKEVLCLVSHVPDYMGQDCFFALSVN